MDLARSTVRRTYELNTLLVDGPIEPIPVLVYHRQDQTGPKPVVIYYHGVNQNKEAYVDTHPVARQLADRGHLVVIPDAPGHGERSTAAHLTERLQRSLAKEFSSDVEQAADEAPALLRWLDRHRDVDASRIAVAGVSMGGYTAAVVASRHARRLGAAVCIAGCANLRRCFAETDSVGPGRYGPADRALDADTSDRIDRIDPIGHLDSFAPLPLLLLHGDRDTWNPSATTEEFAAAIHDQYTACPAALRVRIIAGAPHWPPGMVAVQEAVTWIDHHL